MSDKKTKVPEKESLLYVKIFIAVFAVVVGIALIFKIGSLYINRNFTSSSFTFLVLEKDAYIVRVDKDSRQVSVAKITDIPDNFYLASRTYQEIYLGVPLEGEVVYRDRADEESFSQNFFSFPRLLELLTRRDKIRYKQINPIDIINIYLTAKFAQSIQTESFSLREFSVQNFLKNGMNQKLSDLFQDSEIFNEATSIEIDNTTSINGLGEMVSSMLQDAGYNVVFVATKNNSTRTKIIYRGEENNSLKRLQLIFDAPLVKSTESGQADINIVLGTNIY